MTKKYSIFIIWLVAFFSLAVIILILTAPSWSSPAVLFVTSTVPKTLPPTVILKGGGFSDATRLWLVPERSIRTATTASLETYGRPAHFVRRDDHLYVANWEGGLFIVQGLQSPVPLISGVLNSNGQGMEVVLRQKEALMAAGSGGLQIIDIRDAVNPQLLAELKSVAPALSVASAGKIAYVAAGKAGVEVVDLSDPRSPQRLGQLANIPEAYKVICDKELLIIATGNGGLIYNISQPEQPYRLAQLPVVGGVNTVMTQRGNTLYWATKTLHESRLYSIDLSRSESPAVRMSVPLNGTPTGISCSEDQVVIAMGSSGAQVFSIVGEDRLELYQTIAAKYRTRFALSLGDDLWITDMEGDLLRLNQQAAATLTTPSPLPDFFPQIPPLVTSQLLLLGDDVGLAIYDREDDNVPTLLARLPMTGLVQLYLTADQQLWLAVRDDPPLLTGKLISVDISTPHIPRIITEIPLPRPPEIIGEIGKTLVVDTPSLAKTRYDVIQAAFLYFINIALPQRPVLISTYPLAYPCSGISTADHALVMMQPNGIFRVLDLTEIHSPKERGSFQMPWLQEAAWSKPVKIAVKNHVAFISSQLGDVVAINFSDPFHPRISGEFTLSGQARSLRISDNLLLAEVNKAGLVVIDINNPLTPEFLGTIALSSFQIRGTVQGGMLWYMIPYTKGIFSLPLPRRLQSTVVSTDRLRARLEQQPQPGAYRLWLTDHQNHTVVPGVSWVRPEEPGR